jgi:ABC-type bacteriocin/lantibiotic exporter with double-glycine peptidase domain
MLVGVPEDQFLRSIQLDSFSCGSHSVFMVLRFFGITLRHGRVKTLLGTNPETGTTIEPMVRLLRRRGLRVGYRPKIGWRGLLSALARGRVAIVHLDGDHLAVVHGVVRSAEGYNVLIADPSLFRCRGRRITTTQFLRERWTGWALLVSRPSAARRTIVSRGRS